MDFKRAFVTYVFSTLTLVTLDAPYGQILASEGAINLKEFLSEVQSENLAIKAESASLEAAKEEASGIALPAPMAAITQMQDQSGKATNFEMNQTIPFPTKLSNNYRARNLEADAKAAQFRTREREVLADAKVLYFKLWKAQERKALLKDKKSAIEQHLKLSRAATRSDSFLKIHLIKAESDLDLLENEIIQAEQELREKQIQIAEMLNRDPSEYKLVASDFPLSPLPKDEPTQSSNQFEFKRLSLEALKAREGEAKSMWFPEFNLRYREMGGTQMMPRYSEVMVGASIPFFFFWGPKALSVKAAAERLEGEFRLSEEQRRIESRRAILVAKAVSLKKQLEQFNEKLLPRAEKRMRLVHNLAPRDMETIQDHRETMEAFPELKLKELDIRERYEEAIADLEKFQSGETK